MGDVDGVWAGVSEGAISTAAVSVGVVGEAGSVEAGCWIGSAGELSGEGGAGGRGVEAA